MVHVFDWKILAFQLAFAQKELLKVMENVFLQRVAQLQQPLQLLLLWECIARLAWVVQLSEEVDYFSILHPGLHQKSLATDLLLTAFVEVCLN